MSTSTCPKCSVAIPAANINIGEGAALCPTCGTLSRLSDVVSQGRPVDESLAKRPRGCTKFMRGDEVFVRASLRSMSGMAGMLFFAIFWNGIVSVFVLVALAGLYINLIGPLPEWFPAPEFTDSDGEPMSMGMTLFLCVFLIPFVLVGVGTAMMAIVSMFGSVDVRLRGDRGSVCTGVGPLRWRRRFDASAVRRVAMGESSYEVNGRKKPLIIIEADRTLRLGSMLPDERRDWLRAVLHVLLMDNSRKRDELLSRACTAQDFRRP